MERNPFGPDQDLNGVKPPEVRSGRGCAPRILIICLVVAGLGFICCCGGVAYFGMALVTEEIADQLRYHPVVLEHVGEVEEFQLAWAKSINEEDNDDVVLQREGHQGARRHRMRAHNQR